MYFGGQRSRSISGATCTLHEAHWVHSRVQRYGIRRPSSEWASERELPTLLPPRRVQRSLVVPRKVWGAHHPVLQVGPGRWIRAELRRSAGLRPGSGLKGLVRRQAEHLDVPHGPVHEQGVRLVDMGVATAMLLPSQVIAALEALVVLIGGAVPAVGRDQHALRDLGDLL